MPVTTRYHPLPYYQLLLGHSEGEIIQTPQKMETSFIRQLIQNLLIASMNIQINSSSNK
jgi:hypothetical protein